MDLKDLVWTHKLVSKRNTACEILVSNAAMGVDIRKDAKALLSLWMKDAKAFEALADHIIHNPVPFK